MRTVIPLFLVALASVATVGAHNGAAKPAVVETNVCDLVKHPSHFDKSNVRVRAIVMSDLIEHTMLADKGCPGRGVSLWIPHELDDSTDVRALRSELSRQWAIPPSNTQINAVFEGTFLREHRKLYLKVLGIHRIDLAARCALTVETSPLHSPPWVKALFPMLIGERPVAPKNKLQSFGL